MAVLQIIVFAFTVISIQSAPIHVDEAPFWTISRGRDNVDDVRRAQLGDLLKDAFPLLKREIDALKTDERFIIEKVRGALSDAVRRGELSRQNARDVILEIVKAAKEKKLDIYIALRNLLDEGVKRGIIGRSARLKTFVHAVLEKIHKKAADSTEGVEKALEKAVEAGIISQATADQLKKLEASLPDFDENPELMPYTVMIGGQLRDAITDVMGGHGKLIDNFRNVFRDAITDGLLSRAQVAEVLREVIRAIRLRKLNMLGRINEFLDKGVEEGIIDGDTRLRLLLKSIRERHHETEPTRAAAIEATIEGALEAGIINARTARKLKELAPKDEVIEEEILPF